MSAITYDEVYVYRTLSESPGLTLPEQIVTIKGSQRLDKELNTWQIYKSISMIGCVNLPTMDIMGLRKKLS